MPGAAPPNHLVLYGSLRQGEASYLKLELEQALKYLRPVRFPGRMYDLGDFPGVVLDRPTGMIHGELFAILDPAVLARLDAFEGYRPNDRRPYHPIKRWGSLYLRQVITVEHIEAWVYVFNAPGPRILRPRPTAPSGDWVRHRRTRGR